MCSIDKPCFGYHGFLCWRGDSCLKGRWKHGYEKTKYLLVSEDIPWHWYGVVPESVWQRCVKNRRKCLSNVKERTGLVIKSPLWEGLIEVGVSDEVKVEYNLTETNVVLYNTTINNALIYDEKCILCGKIHLDDINANICVNIYESKLALVSCLPKRIFKEVTDRSLPEGKNKTYEYVRVWNEDY